ncbi:hypothetical protein NIES4074_47270 [Cylindrospermum sp. NIES-4074]|nr:hypothetical protein NIES4074_47270 [Cylindrospermum sp. NIES-4074]
MNFKSSLGWKLTVCKETQTSGNARGNEGGGEVAVVWGFFKSQTGILEEKFSSFSKVVCFITRNKNFAQMIFSMNAIEFAE